MSRPPLSASTRLAAVLGDPVDHSLSPALHNAAFDALDVDAVFLALRTPAPRLPAAVETLAAIGAVGASITVPHKRAVIDSCDRLSPLAASIGAVNCLELAGGTVIGHNTDASGFAASLVESFGARATADPWRPLILGAGGAARAVCAGLDSLSSEPAVVIARAPAAATWIEARPWTRAELATHLRRANLIVDCTPVGLDDRSTFPCPLELGVCPPDAVVGSLVYHRETRLLADARERGLATQDGMGMLVHQALDALRIWLGEAPPASELWTVAGAHRPPTAR